MKEITFKITKDGSKVETKASGFDGMTCRDVAKSVIDGLGTVIHDEDKLDSEVTENIRIK